MAKHSRRHQEEEEEDQEIEYEVSQTNELVYDPDQNRDEKRALRQDYRRLQENGTPYKAC